MPWKFHKEAITFCFLQYAKGGIAVEARCATGVYAIISVNLPDAPPLPKDQFYLKSWSENEQIARSMIAEGIIEVVNPPVRAQLEFVTAEAFRFTEQGMQYCSNKRGQTTHQEALTQADSTSSRMTKGDNENEPGRVRAL